MSEHDGADRMRRSAEDLSALFFFENFLSSSFQISTTLLLACLSAIIHASPGFEVQRDYFYSEPTTSTTTVHIRSRRRVNSVNSVLVHILT